jgi:hypothetical protein
MKEKFQIVYISEKNNPSAIHSYFQEEALALKQLGILVDIIPFPEAKKLMYRGFSIRKKEFYPNDSRYINTSESCLGLFYLSLYYPYIQDLSIETFFENDLNKNTLVKIKEKGWNKVFIKKEISALEHIEEGKSVWPNTSLEEMKVLFDEMQIEGKYAIRKFIEKDIIDQEERYWVMNGNIYHRTNHIPEVVKKAAERLNKLGSRYYTIDATPEFVVEVNPGESSDRHAVNSPELFASWIKKEFC